MRIKTIKELAYKKFCKDILGIKYLEYNTGKIEIPLQNTKK